MQITLTNTGKRFNREWIFRHLDYTFTTGNSYAITGPNGSGKSTLLQVIAGATLHSEGEVRHEPGSDAYEHISISAPYLELIEEMTANEFFDFHSSFKKLTKSMEEILSIVQLQSAANKQIRYFSSGMKQRLKLAQAFFSETSVLLLDEPTTNLDADGIELYRRLINDYTNDRLVIVSSNDVAEYDFCREVISMTDFKESASDKLQAASRL